MEDRKLEAAESLALIGRMIENTRSRMVRNSGRPLLAWGYATVLTTLAVWGAVLYFQDPRWNYLWLMLPLLGWLLMWISHNSIGHARVLYRHLPGVIAWHRLALV